MSKYGNLILVTNCSFVRGFSHEGKLTQLGDKNRKFNALFLKLCQNSHVRMFLCQNMYLPNSYSSRLKDQLRQKTNKMPNETHSLES